MTGYTVVAVIQSYDRSNTPVDMCYYTGPSLPSAMAALVSAAASHTDDESVPESVRYRTLSVRLDITEPEPFEVIAETTVIVDGDLEVSEDDIAHAEEVIGRLAKPRLLSFNSEDYSFTFDHCIYADDPEADCAGPRVGMARFDNGLTAPMCEYHANR
jgi:hypothetical protein